MPYKRNNVGDLYTCRTRINKLSAAYIDREFNFLLIITANDMHYFSTSF